MIPEKNALTGASYVGQTEDVGILPCLKHEGRVTSWWQPSEEELAVLNGGGQVVLSTCSEIVFPHMIYTSRLVTLEEFAAQFDETPPRVAKLIEEGSDLLVPTMLVNAEGVWEDAATLAAITPDLSAPDADGAWWFHDPVKGWRVCEVDIARGLVHVPGRERHLPLSEMRGKGHYWARPFAPSYPADEDGKPVLHAELPVEERREVEEVIAEEEGKEEFVNGLLLGELRFHLLNDREGAWKLVAQYANRTTIMACYSRMACMGPVMRLLRVFALTRRTGVRLGAGCKMALSTSLAVTEFMLMPKFRRFILEDGLNRDGKLPPHLAGVNEAVIAALRLHEMERNMVGIPSKVIPARFAAACLAEIAVLATPILLWAVYTERLSFVVEVALILAWSFALVHVLFLSPKPSLMSSIERLASAVRRQQDSEGRDVFPH